MVRFLFAAPACMILATAAAGAITSLGLSQSAPSKWETAQFALAPSAPPSDAKDRAVRPTTSRILHQANDGLFYTSALINGHPIRFIVDSGSSVVVLNDADAVRAGVNDDGFARVAVQTAGGDTGMKLVTLNRVTVAGQSIQHVDAAIMGTGLRVSLMGQSVLSRLHLVQFKNDELRLN